MIVNVIFKIHHTIAATRLSSWITRSQHRGRIFLLFQSFYIIRQVIPDECGKMVITYSGADHRVSNLNMYVLFVTCFSFEKGICHLHFEEECHQYGCLLCSYCNGFNCWLTLGIQKLSNSSRMHLPNKDWHEPNAYFLLSGTPKIRLLIIQQFVVYTRTK